MNELLNKPLFVINFLTGFIFIIAAIIQLKFPPKKINSFYGYRTKSSMKSSEAWDFAQTYSSKLMLRFGAGLCLIGLLLKNISLINLEYEIIASIFIVLIIIFIMIILVEKQLDKKF
ncbi:MAG: SdpI family protein [Ignavibacterium sp.]|nr:SdpI family protein [Ignavibacterium sp.]MCX7611776.1 SdpI family protein [Ignavibacterium sp.]MDW8376355.1 SdpI family protein [Ignavibacteriales bacterium]